MTVEVSSNNNWLQVKQLAFRTIGKDTNKEPTSEWKKKMLKCQHSPIRNVVLTITFRDIPYWVAMHFARHKVGCEHYISSQRTDRSKTGVDREKLPQDSLVDYTIIANAESIINISRKRLCFQASEKTRKAWQQAVSKIREVEPELADVCVSECIYRGFCPEFNKCDKMTDIAMVTQIEKYRRV